MGKREQYHSGDPRHAKTYSVKFGPQEQKNYEAGCQQYGDRSRTFDNCGYHKQDGWLVHSVSHQGTWLEAFEKSGYDAHSTRLWTH
jgi:hypothetical protein